MLLVEPGFATETVSELAEVLAIVPFEERLGHVQVVSVIVEVV
jgi:hypothetical protein